MQIEKNFDKAAKFVRSVAALGAELAVLPEYHLTSWVPNDPGFIGLCEQWETYLQKYRDLAKECKICAYNFKTPCLDLREHKYGLDRNSLQLFRYRPWNDSRVP